MIWRHSLLQIKQGYALILPHVNNEINPQTLMHSLLENNIANHNKFNVYHTL